MENSKYIDDLKDIKNLMNKSSKFISLSGWSGICIGIMALIAAFVAKNLINLEYYLYSKSTIELSEVLEVLKQKLLVLFVITLVLSLCLGIIFTYNKSKRIGQKIWTEQTKILLINLALPLAIGGLCCLVLFLKGLLIYIAPFTLIFYGLALINASKYTLNEIRSLGIIESILGIIGLYYAGYGLLLWAIGFGVLHIIYGIVMKIKHN